MTNINARGDASRQSQPLIDKVAPDNCHVTGEIVEVITTIATPTAVAAGIKYGLQSWDNHVTQQAETQREQIRQDGETARAVIAAQTSSQTDEHA
ncbi:hypothetical protein [Streptomyces sp. NPDC050538]|uniref:hypothetical protein n=1 Tax=Streptomyces sp. NPDC050538 TaxID=3365627 RepID=UPI00378E3C16